METIGLLFNQLFDRISQAIQQAQNAGLILEVNAGAQALNLLDQAKQSLNDLLDKTASDLSAQQQQAISGIQSVVTNLENHVIDNLTSKVQLIFDQLPFVGEFPLISSFSGNMVASNSDVLFQLNGNFKHIAKAGFTADLIIGHNVIKNATKATELITFQVDKSLFTFSDDKVTYIPFSVDIPYPVGLLLLRKKIATFNFIFIVLPKSAGHFVLQTTKKVTVRHQASDVCNNLQWDSSDDDIDKVDGKNMEDGWQCIRESVTYHFSRQEGDWSDFGNVSTSTFVGWHFKTRHHRFGTSGKLTVSLTYNKWKDIQEDQTVSSADLVLNWGDVKALSIDPTATWKIIYHQFDGVTKEYISSDNSNPYIKINTAGNQISLKVVPQ